jgi:hypothetical protein
MVELSELVVENEMNGLLITCGFLECCLPRLRGFARMLLARLELAGYAERQFLRPAITHVCWCDRSCKMVGVILSEDRPQLS